MTRRGVILLGAIVAVLVVGGLVLFGDDIIAATQGQVACGCIEYSGEENHIG